MPSKAGAAASTDDATTSTRAPDPESVEREANDFFDWLTGGPGPARNLLRSPRRALLGMIRLRRLPVFIAELRRTGEGPEVLWPLERSPISRATTAGATAVLRLPETAAELTLGSSMQTLRRKTRAALKAGVHWRAVDDPEERRSLLLLADEHERTGTRAEYRMTAPVLDGLDAIGLWLVAYDADERPLLLSVTPVDGEWAVLRYFRTLTTGDSASLARYYLTQVLAEQLIERRVRFLADSLSPLRITAGLRHFQRMVGFRLIRIRPVCR